MRVLSSTLVVTGLLSTGLSHAQEVLQARRVAAAPEVDGVVDPVWADAPVSVIRVAPIPEAMITVNREKQTGKYAKNWSKESFTQIDQVELKAVYTEDEIFFLARWQDASHDSVHKPWKWEGDEATGEYRAGAEREDRIAFHFPIRGEFTANMLADVDAVVDVWQWKAARTNPIGIVHDKSHVYSLTLPRGRSSTHFTAAGTEIYMIRAGDAGQSPYGTTDVDPFIHQGAMVPHYEPNVPTAADALDVRGKGAWTDGAWAVEIGRRLDTGNHETDTVFDPSAATKMAVAVFDHVGDHFHAVSGVVTLEFLE